jgi:hypothetical protein
MALKHAVTNGHDLIPLAFENGTHGQLPRELFCLSLPVVATHFQKRSSILPNIANQLMMQFIM